MHFIPRKPLATHGYLIVLRYPHAPAKCTRGGGWSYSTVFPNEEKKLSFLVGDKNHKVLVFVEKNELLEKFYLAPEDYERLKEIKDLTDRAKTMEKIFKRSYMLLKIERSFSFLTLFGNGHSEERKHHYSSFIEKMEQINKADTIAFHSYLNAFELLLEEYIAHPYDNYGILGEKMLDYIFETKLMEDISILYRWLPQQMAYIKQFLDDDIDIDYENDHKAKSGSTKEDTTNASSRLLEKEEVATSIETVDSSEGTDPLRRHHHHHHTTSRTDLTTLAIHAAPSTPYATAAPSDLHNHTGMSVDDTTMTHSPPPRLHSSSTEVVALLSCDTTTTYQSILSTPDHTPDHTPGHHIPDTPHTPVTNTSRTPTTPPTSTGDIDTPIPAPPTTHSTTTTTAAIHSTATAIATASPTLSSEIMGLKQLYIRMKHKYEEIIVLVPLWYTKNERDEWTGLLSPDLSTRLSATKTEFYLRHYGTQPDLLRYLGLDLWYSEGNCEKASELFIHNYLMNEKELALNSLLLTTLPRTMYKYSSWIRELNLAHNRICDVSPIAALKYLEVLDLTGNPIGEYFGIQDLKPLNALERLSEVKLYYMLGNLSMLGKLLQVNLLHVTHLAWTDSEGKKYLLAREKEEYLKDFWLRRNELLLSSLCSAMINSLACWGGPSSLSNNPGTLAGTTLATTTTTANVLTTPGGVTSSSIGWQTTSTSNTSQLLHTSVTLKDRMRLSFVDSLGESMKLRVSQAKTKAKHGMYALSLSYLLQNTWSSTSILNSLSFGSAHSFLITKHTTITMKHFPKEILAKVFTTFSSSTILSPMMNTNTNKTKTFDSATGSAKSVAGMSVEEEEGNEMSEADEKLLEQEKDYRIHQFLTYEEPILLWLSRIERVLGYMTLETWKSYEARAEEQRKEEDLEYTNEETGNDYEIRTRKVTFADKVEDELGTGESEEEMDDVLERISNNAIPIILEKLQEVLLYCLENPYFFHEIFIPLLLECLSTSMNIYYPHCTTMTSSAHRLIVYFNLLIRRMVISKTIYYAKQKLLYRRSLQQQQQQQQQEQQLQQQQVLSTPTSSTSTRRRSRSSSATENTLSSAATTSSHTTTLLLPTKQEVEEIVALFCAFYPFQIVKDFCQQILYQKYKTLMIYDIDEPIEESLDYEQPLLYFFKEKFPALALPMMFTPMEKIRVYTNAACLQELKNDEQSNNFRIFMVSELQEEFRVKLQSKEDWIQYLAYDPQWKDYLETCFFDPHTSNTSTTNTTSGIPGMTSTGNGTSNGTGTGSSGSQSPTTTTTTMSTTMSTTAGTTVVGRSTASMGLNNNDKVLMVHPLPLPVPLPSATTDNLGGMLPTTTSGKERSVSFSSLSSSIYSSRKHLSSQPHTGPGPGPPGRALSTTATIGGGGGGGGVPSFLQPPQPPILLPSPYHDHHTGITTGTTTAATANHHENMIAMINSFGAFFTPPGTAARCPTPPPPPLFDSPSPRQQPPLHPHAHPHNKHNRRHSSTTAQQGRHPTVDDTGMITGGAPTAITGPSEMVIPLDPDYLQQSYQIMNHYKQQKQENERAQSDKLRTLTMQLLQEYQLYDQFP